MAGALIWMLGAPGARWANVTPKRRSKSTASTKARLSPGRRAVEDRRELRLQTQCFIIRAPIETLVVLE